MYFPCIDFDFPGEGTSMSERSLSCGAVSTGMFYPELQDNLGDTVWVAAVTDLRKWAP